MKLRSFKEKLPLLGTNILVVHENGKYVGICEFNLECRKCILSNKNEYYPQDYYSDDPSENAEYDIRISDHWCYPSELYN